MDVHSSKQLDPMNVLGCQQGPASKLITSSASTWCGRTGRWEDKWADPEWGSKHVTSDEPQSQSSALRLWGTHQLLLVWWFDPQLICQLVEFFISLLTFAATWGVLVTVNKDLEH